MKNNKGFTLIEMIIAIAIVGVMATATIAALNPFAQFQKASDAKRKSDIAQIQRALEVYYQDNNQKYPDQNGPADYRMKDKKTGLPIDWGKSWQPYMNVVPKDPATGKNYVYYSPDGQTYYLYVTLDKVASADRCSGPNPPCRANTCGSSNCNFGVSSPNVVP